MQVITAVLGYEPVQFLIIAGLGTFFVVKGAESIGAKVAREYTFDLEGNVSRAYGTAIRSLATMVVGIASALKIPSIISAVAKVVAAATGAGS
jgi:hypothetical protein